MPGVTLASLLNYVLVAGIALTAIKLFVTGLYKRYPFFFLYFVFRVPSSIYLLNADVHAKSYAIAWLYGEGITIIFYILLVVELYRLVLERYRGLQTLGRWAMYVSVIVSAVASVLLSMLPRIRDSLYHGKTLSYFSLMIFAERGIDTALAIFIFLILLFLSRYPVRLSQNAQVHAIVYTIFFLGSTLNLLLRTIWGLRVADAVNTALAVISVCSVFAWLALLSPSGEEVRATQPRMAPEKEKRLLGQLELLNATMLRVSRQQIR
jgi:hypothetical protein